MKSERVTFLAEPEFKAFLTAEAQREQPSVGELIRRRYERRPSEEVECKEGHHRYGHSGERESEQKYRDGPCLIEREVKRDGSFKEKIDCQG